MDDYRHCLNALMARVACIELALSFSDKEKADELYEEAIQWFKTTYELRTKR